jgi:toxin ParE1/3/4
VSLPVAFRDLAGEDVQEAVTWYEAQVPGLGARFVSSLQLVVALISEHPLACAVAYKNIRRALLPSFPYAVFYLVLPDRVRVLACLHQRRDPRSVRERVSVRGGG